MTAAAEVVNVRRAECETPCRQCGRTIRAGCRVALVLGIGDTCLRCLVPRPPDDATDDTTQAPREQGR